MTFCQAKWKIFECKQNSELKFMTKKNKSMMEYS